MFMFALVCIRGEHIGSPQQHSQLFLYYLLGNPFAIFHQSSNIYSRRDIAYLQCFIVARNFPTVNRSSGNIG